MEIRGKFGEKIQQIKLVLFASFFHSVFRFSQLFTFKTKKFAQNRLCERFPLTFGEMIRLTASTLENLQVTQQKSLDVIPQKWLQPGACFRPESPSQARLPGLCFGPESQAHLPRACLGLEPLLLLEHVSDRTRPPRSTAPSSWSKFYRPPTWSAFQTGAPILGLPRSLDLSMMP